MSLKIAAVGAAALTAAGLAAVLGMPPASPGADQDRTLTGCLRGGSSATVFILRNASDGKGSDDYLLVAIPQSVSPKEALKKLFSTWPPASPSKWYRPITPRALPPPSKLACSSLVVCSSR